MVLGQNERLVNSGCGITEDWVLDAGEMIIDGFDYARVAFIISDKYQEIGDAIMHDMVRGATSIKTRGLYRNIEREMIMTVTTMKEIPALTDKIKEIDPSAFIVIANAHEVLGQGFRRRL